MIAPLRRLRSGLDRLGRLKKRTPGAAAAPGRTGSDGGRLYAEELEELIRELAARGVHFLSSEVRALPSGQERLFTVSAIIGAAQREGAR